jgi:hypothetical protein
VLWGALGLKAKARYDDLVARCGGRCGPAQEGSIDAGRRETAASRAGLAIGLVGLSAGAALFAVDAVGRRGGSAAGALDWQVAVGPREAGLQVGGGF